MYLSCKILYNTDMETNNFAYENTTSTELVSIPRAQYEKFLTLEEALRDTQSSNALLKFRIESLEERLALMRRQGFAPKSEKRIAKPDPSVQSLFDEPEYIQSESREPEEAVKVKEHERKKKSKGSILDKLPEGTIQEVVEHRLAPEDAQCPKCGSAMEVIGKKTYRTLVIIPAQYKLRIDVCYTYACKNCPQNGDNVTVVEAPRPKQAIPGSFASPEAIAHIMTQKYVMGSPLYRLEQEFHRQGLELSRQTMANWLLESAKEWLKPVYDLLHERLLAHDVLHADETTLQVLHEDGRKAQSKSYMWVYRTSGCAEHAIVLYKYEQTRSADAPRKFLEGFRGYLHTDGYHVYHMLNPGITSVGCLVHARRKFNDVISITKRAGVNQDAAKAVGFFTKIFKIEDALAKKSAEERYQKRLESEKPILDELFAWAEALYVTPKSKLGEAVGYLLNQRKYLYNYLLDGRLESSNNRAERSVKPFVIARKNFLFANTAGGAEGSSIIFSLIETAKENGLDPYRYLAHVLSLAPNLDRTSPDWAEQLLPENAPECCQANYKGK